MNDWPGRSHFTAARVQVWEREKFQMMFLAPFFTAIPDEHAETWIAHEMAHVYQFAMDTLYSHPPLPRSCLISLLSRELDAPYETLVADYGQQAVDEFLDEVSYKFGGVEIEAQGILMGWGFDVDGLERWRRENADAIFPA